MGLFENSSDEGLTIGRDPRTVSAEEYKEAGIEFVTGLKAIRLKCLDCCVGSQSEVRKCVAVDCVLWPLRMGAVPKGLREAADL
jgi:hypothetical protein